VSISAGARSLPTVTPDDSNDKNAKHRSRLEREIDEILTSARADSLPPAEGKKRLTALPNVPGARRRQWSGLLAPQRRGALMIVLALLLAFLAVLVSDASQLLANLLVMGAVVAFAWPIVARARSGSGSRSMPPPSRMWRGRELDITPTRSSPIENLRDWWNRRPRR
jgi:hypothetical protein